jgi:hypothetical protein
MTDNPRTLRPASQAPVPRLGDRRDRGGIDRIGRGGGRDPNPRSWRGEQRDAGLERHDRRFYMPLARVALLAALAARCRQQRFALCVDALGEARSRPHGLPAVNQGLV